MLSIYVSTGDSNSGPHTCAEGTALSSHLSSTKISVLYLSCLFFSSASLFSCFYDFSFIFWKVTHEFTHYVSHITWYYIHCFCWDLKLKFYDQAISLHFSTLLMLSFPLRHIRKLIPPPCELYNFWLVCFSLQREA